MTTVEVPSDEEVVEMLRKLGERASARLLCEALIAAGHPIRQSQLAIQRAAERGRIVVNADLTLSATIEAVAA